MALKPERIVTESIGDRYTMLNQEVEQGTVLHVSASSATICDVYTEVSGVTTADKPFVAGILLTDVEHDYRADSLGVMTRPMNFQRNVVGSGQKIALLTRGRIKTNLVSTHLGVPLFGSGAYAESSGYISCEIGDQLDDGTAQNRRKIGYFTSSADADGYYEIVIDVTNA